MQTLWQDLQFAARILRKKVRSASVGCAVTGRCRRRVGFQHNERADAAPSECAQAESLIAGVRA